MSAGAHPELKDAPDETHLLLEVQWDHSTATYLYPAIKKGDIWHVGGQRYRWRMFQNSWLERCKKVWVVSEYQELV